MTTWVRPQGGRERGLRGLARAWIAVLVEPRAFFRDAVSPGDQAPGLLFAMAVVLVAGATRVLADPAVVPPIGGSRVLAAVFVLAFLVLLVAPLALHAAAALLIVCLLPVTLRRDSEARAGVSQTVQVLAYATAPCALVGLPLPPLQVVCALYGAALLVVGVATVHRVAVPTALVLGAPTALLVFGDWFGGFAAAVAVYPPLGDWWTGVERAATAAIERLRRRLGLAVDPSGAIGRSGAVGRSG